MIASTSIEPPADRAARADRLHRRLQLQRAALRRARIELATPQPDPSIAQMRAAYALARGQQALAEHDAQDVAA